MQLTAHDLTCIRGGRTLFEGLSLAAAGGRSLLVTGPNGAGKTSLLRILAGLLVPAAGTIALRGGREDEPVGAQAHYLGHLNGVKRALTVAENLAFWAGYYGGAPEDALQRFALVPLRDIPAGLLSAGQARRLGLARLAVAPRPLWLLDEPAASLDAASRKILAAAMRAHLKEGGIVVAATHAPLGLKFTRTLRLGGRA